MCFVLTSLRLYASWSLTAARKLCCWELCFPQHAWHGKVIMVDLWPLESRDGHAPCWLFMQSLAPAFLLVYDANQSILCFGLSLILSWWQFFSDQTTLLKLETPNTGQSNCFHVSLRQTLPPGFLPAKQPKHQRHGLWSRVVWQSWETAGKIQSEEKHIHTIDMASMQPSK